MTTSDRMTIMFKSDTQARTQPPARSFRRQALFLAMIALGVVYLLWNIPALDGLIYPFRLFVSYVHEAGHSVTAIITGGSVIGFTISPDGSGVATTVGGTRALILPAGYLGAALFGAILFYLVNTVRYTRFIAVVIGAGLL
ncbi:MAG TPA: M50 family metallopeptidase, partial [Phototrophicaceae bacterium]|nr:M50 family metallopeptidase [Phototrophicaceae bacterium]